MKNIHSREKGQTVIETALMMIFLLVLFFGIAEIARAWWLKNMLNNAARVGVRVAIVTPNLTNALGSGACTSPSGPVVTAACSSITNGQLRATTLIGLTIAGSSPAVSGDTVIVTVQGDFISVVPNLEDLSFGLIRGQMTMQTTASMRYE